MNKDEKIKFVIHGASVSAATVGCGLAQIPGSDMPVLLSIQRIMVGEIASLYGLSVNEAFIKSFILEYIAGYGGRAVSQLLVGWIPAFGNWINATTAASITEAIGWAANSYFESEARNNRKKLA